MLYMSLLWLTFAAVPSPPEGPLRVSEITQTSVTISWSASQDNGGLPITAYVIERRDRRFTSWLRVDSVKPGITSYCIQNLVEGNEYLFRVYSENEEGSSEPLVSAEGVIACREPGSNSFINMLRFYQFLLSHWKCFCSIAYCGWLLVQGEQCSWVTKILLVLEKKNSRYLNYFTSQIVPKITLDFFHGDVRVTEWILLNNNPPMNDDSTVLDAAL